MRRPRLRTLAVAALVVGAGACSSAGSAVGGQRAYGAEPTSTTEPATTTVAATSPAAPVSTPAPGPAPAPPGVGSGSPPTTAGVLSSLPPLVTAPAKEAFDGPNATTWDTRRWNGDAGGSGTVGVTKGVGQMIIDPRGTHEWARALDIEGSWNDFDLTVTLIPQTEGLGSVYVGLRGGGGWRVGTPYLPNQGLSLEYAYARGLPGELRLMQSGADGITDVGSVDAPTVAAGKAARLRLRAEGTLVQAKVWPVGGSEPDEWMLDVETELLEAGTLHLAYRDSPGGVLQWDDLEVIPLP